MCDLISIIVPAFNEVDSIIPLHGEVVAALHGESFAFELLFIDDGSTDGSDRVMAELASTDALVKAILLDRNYGQSAALRAGIDHSSGDVLAILDGDRQNDPSDIPRLAQQLTDVCDFVQGCRQRRRDNWLLRCFPSIVANRWISWYTGFRVRDIGCGTKVMRRHVAVRACLKQNRHRYFALIAHFQGASVRELDVSHRPRESGHSKYGLSRTCTVVRDVVQLRKEFSGHASHTIHENDDEIPYSIKRRIGFGDEPDATARSPEDRIVDRESLH